MHCDCFGAIGLYSDLHCIKSRTVCKPGEEFVSKI
jgi:hypothetical protein